MQFDSNAGFFATPRKYFYIVIIPDAERAKRAERQDYIKGIYLLYIGKGISLVLI